MLHQRPFAAHPFIAPLGVTGAAGQPTKRVSNTDGLVPVLSGLPDDEGIRSAFSSRELRMARFALLIASWPKASWSR